MAVRQRPTSHCLSTTMPIRRFFSRKTQNSSTSDVSTRPPSYRQNMPLPSYSSVQDVDGLNRPEHNTHLRTQSGDVPSVASMSVIESPTSASIAESSFATDAKSMVGSIASDNSAKPTHRWSESFIIYDTYRAKMRKNEHSLLPSIHRRRRNCIQTPHRPS